VSRVLAGLLPALVALVLALATGVAASDAEVPAAGCPPPTATSSTGAVLPPAATALGTTEPTPEQTLVCVGAQAITGATYSHWLTVAKDGSGPSVKGHHVASTSELQTEVLGFLISSDWVLGEAKDLSVSVSAAKVKKEFEHIRKAQFPKRGEFEAFLRDSGQTIADLLLRVELNLLSARIQKQVVAGHHSAVSKRHALSQFVKTFKVKWQAQTYCAAEYDVADCGHVQAMV
jgi:hypothetical protein